MTRNEIWTRSDLTKRQKAVLSYDTPASLRAAQVRFWKNESDLKSAEDAYEASFKAWEAAGRPDKEDVQF